MYGTGSYTTHCSLILDFDGDLYVVEATWPFVKKTLLSDWIQALWDGTAPHGALGWLRLRSECVKLSSH